MAACFLLSFLLVVVAVQASHDVSPLELYWRSVLPNTTMPNAIRELIDPELDVNLVAKRQVKTSRGAGMHHFILSGPLPSTKYILSTFFPKSDLYPTGTQMNEGIDISRDMYGNVFVPLPEADAVPFSSDNLSHLLDHFSMAPSSKEAKILEDYVVSCEKPLLIGEKKFCSASLESLIDNVVSLLGTRDVQAITTVISKAGVGQHEIKGSQVYRTAAPIRSLPDHTKFLVCHPMPPSPQAVHYCHTNVAYKIHMVPLVGNDGSTVNAVTICHHDAVNFNKGFFEVLKVKPGSQPICHFLPENHIIWISK